MLKRILVPVDGSHFSEQAIARALPLAMHSGAELHVALVHVPALPFVLDLSQAPFDAYADDQLRRSEVEYLARVMRAWSASGLGIRAFLLDGEASDSLVAHSIAEQVDLIAMTTHGRGGLSRAWVGSVADRIIRKSDAPVLLLRPLRETSPVTDVWDGHGHVLIPLDGSILSESILETAIAIGSLTDARYTLVQIVTESVESDSKSKQAYDNGNMREVAQAYLERCAIPLRNLGCKVQTRVIVQENCAAGIVEEAARSNCTMIAIGTHGRSGRSRLALGSVADKVLRLTSIPLLALRPAQFRHAT